MRTYQIHYILASGARKPPVVARCANDSEAGELARRMLRLPGDSAEIWFEGGQVGIITAATKDELKKLTFPWDIGVLRS